MNAEQITFGIEIETTIPAGALVVGGYRSGQPLPNAPIGWMVKSDCSIHAGAGRRGAEIVSPVLRGVDGLKQIKEVVAILKGLGARVNSSTGLLIEQLNGTFDQRVAGAVRRTNGRNVTMALWHRPKRLIVARRDNPLHTGTTDRGIYFGSLAEGLPGKVAAIKNGTMVSYKFGSRLSCESAPIAEAARGVKDPIGQGVLRSLRRDYAEVV